MPEVSARENDSNGFMIVRGCPLSCEGIYEYSAKQIGLPGDPNRIVKVYRPREAISDPEAIASFKSVPLIDEHEMLAGLNGKHPEYTAPEDKGIEGILTENVYFDESDGWLKGDVKVFTRKMQETLLNKDDLSLGFGCLFALRPGKWNGQDYEVVQFKIRGNHLAVVEEGRIEGARVLDAFCFDSLNFDNVIKSTEDTDMPKEVVIKGSAADSALEKLQALVPILQGILAESKGTDPAADPAEPVAQPATVAEPAVDSPEEPAAVPAEPVADPAADPAADPDAASATGDMAALIQQVEALVEQIKASCAPAEPVAADPAVVDSLDPEFSDNKPAMDADTPEEKEMAATDSALKTFYADQAKKDKLYAGLSQVVGAFEHAAMDSKSMAAYGAKKLGLSCVKGQEFSVVETYLMGLAKGQKAQTEIVAQKAIMDSKKEQTEVDAYIKGAR